MNRIMKVAKVLQEGPTEPVSVADLRLYLQLEGTAYDAQLAHYITAARRMVEQQVNRSLVDSAVTAQLSVRSNNFSPLPYYPLDEITDIRWKRCPQRILPMQEGYDYVVDGDRIAFLRLGDWFLQYTTTGINDPSLTEAVKVQAGFMYTFRDDATVGGWHPMAKAIIDGYGT